MVRSPVGCGSEVCRTASASFGAVRAPSLPHPTTPFLIGHCECLAHRTPDLSPTGPAGHLPHAGDGEVRGLST